AIFEPFTQADDSISRVYGGTGLGTTIARHLVNLMGGDIHLVSKVGEGSLFWFELCLPRGAPLSEGEGDASGLAKLPSAMAAQALQEQGKIAQLYGARILVAEDNLTNQRVTQMILESGGYEVSIAANGEEALDRLEQGSFDLALFDLSMPVLKGLEALKLYRFSTARPIPVVILSAHVTSDLMGQCERACGVQFIP